MSFVDPASVIRALKLEPGKVVADFGCGAGYFTFEAAKAVKDEGRVYALDILPAALESVSSRGKILGLKNIEPKRANLEKVGGSGLDPESVDWVILKDMLFQNKGKEVILQEVFRVLRSGGKALVMEWIPDDSSVGPDEGMRISEDEAKKLVQSIGFSVVSSIPSGDFHYSFIIEKK